MKPGDGKILLSYINGSDEAVAAAVKTFNKAMADKNFRKSLLIKLKETQEALRNTSSKSDDILKRAGDKSGEVQRLIKIVEKIEQLTETKSSKETKTFLGVENRIK